MEEAAHKAKEDTLKQASARRIPDQNTLEDHDAARGYEMDPVDLIMKIQKLNRDIVVMKGGVRNAVAVYIPDRGPDAHELGLKYVTGFYINEKLPEFSSVTVDQVGVAHKETRGWRSVLLALINAGALDRKKVDLTFGPANGQRSDLWYKSLQGHERN
jgi:hypothetical protein